MVVKEILTGSPAAPHLSPPSSFPRSFSLVPNYWEPGTGYLARVYIYSYYYKVLAFKTEYHLFINACRAWNYEEFSHDCVLTD